MLSKKVHLARSIVIASLAIFLSGPAFAAQGSPPAAPINRNVVDPARHLTVPTRVPMSTAPGSSDEAQRYATREGDAKTLSTFVGGERGGIYIGTGALVVALLVVLIIVLI